jgi:uncharacterized protein (UPF0333 family)
MKFIKNKKIQLPKNYINSITAVVIIVGIVVIGVHLLTGSHAQGPYIAAEAENGTVTGAATVQTNPATSSGKYVQFGTYTSGGGGTGPDIFGIYQDGGTVSNLTAFNQATGVNPLIDEVYEDGGQSSLQSYISTSNFSYTNASGTNIRLLIGVNMCAGSNSAPVGSIATGATGAYNSAYATFAQNMINEGFGNAIIRLGVEVYGSWEACSISNASDAAHFATYYQQVVTAMRSVSGQSFKFDWEVAIPGNSSYTANEAYPGDSYVDYIGFDTYDETWNSSCGYPFSSNATPTQSQCAWTSTILPSLTTMANFATAHGKQSAIPEWGIALRGDGGGLYDDPTFINNMASWIKANNVGFQIYFNSDSGGQQDMLTDGSFPKSLAAFKTAF